MNRKGHLICAAVTALAAWVRVWRGDDVSTAVMLCDVSFAAGVLTVGFGTLGKLAAAGIFDSVSLGIKAALGVRAKAEPVFRNHSERRWSVMLSVMVADGAVLLVASMVLLAFCG